MLVCEVNGLKIVKKKPIERQLQEKKEKSYRKEVKKKRMENAYGKKVKRKRMKKSIERKLKKIKDW